jgi:hypothetical protein
MPKINFQIDYQTLLVLFVSCVNLILLISLMFRMKKVELSVQCVHGELRARITSFITTIAFIVANRRIPDPVIHDSLGVKDSDGYKRR